MSKGDKSRVARRGVWRDNYDAINQNHRPVGPTITWVHRFYPDKTLTLPVGVTAGKNWEEKI